MPIYAIMEGKVTPYILDKNFEQYLPVIPSEVSDERYYEIIINPNVISYINDIMTYRWVM